MFDPIDDGVDPDQAFSDDFCRLLREGLMSVDYQGGDDLRFTLTSRGRAELENPTPAARASDVRVEAIYPIYSGGPGARSDQP